MLRYKWFFLSCFGVGLVLSSLYSLFSNYSYSRQQVLHKQEVQKLIDQKKKITKSDTSNAFTDQSNSLVQELNTRVLSAEAEQVEVVEKTVKDKYKIVLIGDSMIETMGENMDYLEKALKVKYPNTKFTLYNFGKGSVNPDFAIENFDKEFHIGERSFMPVPELKPDIIILGSYSYNPYTPYDLNKHWLKLAELIDLARGVTPDVYLMAEIAPLKSGFGKGVGGINWPEETANQQAKNIKDQLESTVKLAEVKKVEIIDVYTKSKSEDGWGSVEYIDGNDNIHPSIKGQEFTAKIIADSLKLE